MKREVKCPKYKMYYAERGEMPKNIKGIIQDEKQRPRKDARQRPM
jgi:hypothetical protein